MYGPKKKQKDLSFLSSSFLTHKVPKRGLVVMHQSIPPAPSLTLPPADPRALAPFLPWMANSRGWGLLSCQIPRGGDEKRGQMPHSPSPMQHFSLIAQSNSVILSILMCDFLFQLRSSVRSLSQILQTCIN